MSFQDILNKIEQEAQRRQAILQNAHLEAEKILKRPRSKLTKKANGLSSRGRKNLNW